jgi:hypothetical protein
MEPPLCLLCFKPVLLTEPAAKHDGTVVHALCLVKKYPPRKAARQTPPDKSSAA